MFVISDIVSVGGGVNNLTTVKLIEGYCVLKTFTGKTAKRRIESYKNKLEKINRETVNSL